MLASTVHKLVKYYHRLKRNSNEIQILPMKFEFGKKTNLTSIGLDIEDLLRRLKVGNIIPGL